MAMITPPRSRWTRTTLNRAPRVAGVYVVLDGREVIYIGSAFSIRTRIRKHIPRVRWAPTVTRFGELAALTLAYSPNRRYAEHASRELRLLRRLRTTQNIRSR